MVGRVGISVLVLGLAAANVEAQKHPHFDDRGALEWHTGLAAAKAAARQQQKLVFVEYGRQA
ncbi:MAG: hypothetical protein NXI31_20605 [bacterium]|nr:hypothetical protein [bacterium]